MTSQIPLQRMRNALIRIRELALASQPGHLIVPLTTLVAIAEEALAEPGPEDRPALTDSQTRLLEYLRSSMGTRGFAPTAREMADALNIKSPNGAVSVLKVLERKGYIRREPIVSRGIVLIEQAFHTTEEDRCRTTN